MPILNKKTKVLVQGMTGREGRRATKEMLDSGINISCGVTPGKGGQEVEGKPIFDTVSEATAHDPEINMSVLYVPPLMVYDAAMEAMHNKIQTVIIVTENVPVKDATKLVQYAKNNNIRLIGPASVGILNTRIGKIGSIGAPSEASMYTKGNIAIISKSGGMCAETALILTQQGMGQSTVVGIGGEPIIGTTFTDLLPELEKDEETAAIVIFGEIGGTYEQQIAEYKKAHNPKKPIVAFISGQFAETIDRSLSLGHTGAIIENGQNTAKEKKKLLKEAGIIIADYHYQIPDLVKEALNKN